MGQLVVSSFAAAGVLALYAYAVYPLLLLLLAQRSRRRPPAATPDYRPTVSISLPVYNEAKQLREVLDSLLRLEYPKDRIQILVISDASTDGSDEIVSEYADRGVELLRLNQRSGKTAAENAGAPLLRGEIVLNTDASVRIDPRALDRLVAAFADPEVGVASARDVSVGAANSSSNDAESGYVGYEMWLRRLETRVSGIVGASGCCYAIRPELHRIPIPGELSRDFSAALLAREHGLRAVSVEDAICFVPRAPSIQREYRRKVRTMTRGIATLSARRHLLNPVRHGMFAWMLFSHKVCRWLVPWAGAFAIVTMLVASVSEPWTRWPSALFLAAALLALAGWFWPSTRPVPRFLAVPLYLFAGNLAAIQAALNAARGRLNAVWEPTRRERVAPPAAHAPGSSG